MKNFVKNEIEKTLNLNVVLEKPKDKNLAHYAAPVAFALAKELKKSPILIAKELALKFEESKFFKVSAVNGYLNFKLKRELLNEIATKALEDGIKFAKSKSKNNKILLEYVSANPTGPLHIGHVRGAVYGDTLARIGRYVGYDITTEYYINDAGNQMDLLGLSIFLFGKSDILKEDVEFPEVFYRGEYTQNLAKKAAEVFGYEIFTDDKNIEKLSLWGKDEILQIIKKDLANANIEIENWISEKSLYNKLDDTISKLEKCDGIYNKDGKIWLKSTQIGDEKDRVIIREDLRPTYLAGDIVYHNYKFERDFDRYINIWGADHHGYIQRIKASIHFLGYDENKLEVILSQMVGLLKGGEVFKMSKRAGNFILMSDVLDEIGSDALRFIFISKKCDTALEFDVDELKKQDSSNPIFYINYAHARINQIFAKSKKRIDDVIGVDFKNLDENALNLVFEALTLNEILEDAFNTRQLQKLPEFLRNLASNFHKFYNENKVLGSELENELLKVFGIVGLCIRTGLDLMGICAKNIMIKD
ncbi:arginine--tRNA ligase [Campylobacter sp. FMV-PI01]|uniref:Arginine--tRNA ligase n=1 Tax=Campylobacter portucalensis TaxID=2608384 RepID=A0A6L5WKI2_9BACT|nr:arginine--tRNA ligase [Campylobacter portucalensis]MSN96363.1 arginine--tRNA ligase [Campylobacter portucalensis]